MTLLEIRSGVVIEKSAGPVVITLGPGRRRFSLVLRSNLAQTSPFARTSHPSGTVLNNLITVTSASSLGF